MVLKISYLKHKLENFAWENIYKFSSFRLFVTPWTAARGASLSINNSRSLLRFMSIELVMPSNHLILCCPRLLLASIFSSIRVFSNGLALHIRWPKYWSFSFSISPSNDYWGLISFRMDLLDLLAVQGTLRSLLQHHSKLCEIKNFDRHYSEASHAKLELDCKENSTVPITGSRDQYQSQYVGCSLFLL